MSLTINKLILKHNFRLFSTMKKAAIYTKTGDKGTTSLYNGERKSKTDITFEVLGQIDHLNSQIGFAKEQCKLALEHAEAKESNPERHEFVEKEQLENIQNRLFEIGSHVATPRDSSKGEDDKKLYTVFDETYIEMLEQWIDTYDNDLPPLKSFILPGGGIGSASLHLCRTSCRTVERNLFYLINDEKVDISVGRYINRLSDYFFTLARVMSQKCNIEDTVYKSEQKAKFLEDKKD